jgi:hypothetical protein
VDLIYSLSTSLSYYLAATTDVKIKVQMGLHPQPPRRVKEVEKDLFRCPYFQQLNTKAKVFSILIVCNDDNLG